MSLECPENDCYCQSGSGLGKGKLRFAKQFRAAHDVFC